MAVDLGDFTESLEREVTPLGTTTFAAVTDTQWVGYLTDAFWEARLDGFLEGYSADDDGVVTPTLGQDDIPRQLIALVIVYAGIRVLRNRILNTNTMFRAKAGPVEYETQQGATALAEMLKQLAATKARLLEQADAAADANATAVSMFDTYSTRMLDPFGGYAVDAGLVG